MEERKRYGDLLLRAAQAADLPLQAADLPLITLTGRRRALIENHKGLEALEPDGVLIRCRGGLIRVRGSGLKLAAMTDTELLLTGEIAGVDLETPGKEDAHGPAS